MQTNTTPNQELLDQLATLDAQRDALIAQLPQPEASPKKLLTDRLFNVLDTVKGQVSRAGDATLKDIATAPVTGAKALVTNVKTLRLQMPIKKV